MAERPFAFVTGSTRNIGRATVVELARRGFDVGINGTADGDAARETAEAARAEGAKAHVFIGNVFEPAALTAIFERIGREVGRLDALVNNAALRREVAFDAIDLEEWRSVVHPQLDTLFLSVKLALPLLRASGRGRIVNVGGLSAHLGAKDRAHVVLVKSAVVGLTRALARDFADDGITVNAVIPGNIDTARAGPVPAHMANAKGRKGRPEEVAFAIANLCEPQSAYVTGQSIHVNGGAYLSS